MFKMCYVDMLKKQIDEYSNKIVFLKDRIKSDNDPSVKNIIRLEIEHAEIHKHQLNKLIIVFREAI